MALSPQPEAGRVPTFHIVTLFSFSLARGFLRDGLGPGLGVDLRPAAMATNGTAQCLEITEKGWQWLREHAGEGG